MITRLPSYQHEYVDHWSGDQALVQRPVPPPDDATAAVKEAHAKAVDDYERKLRVARETGNWQPLIIEGQSPTPFVMGQVDRNAWRSLRDRLRLPPGTPGWVGPTQGVALLFRLALQRVVGLDLEVARRADARWENWVMAQPDIVTELDARFSPGIVAELGSEVFERLQGLSPK